MHPLKRLSARAEHARRTARLLKTPLLLDLIEQKKELKPVLDIRQTIDAY